MEDEEGRIRKVKEERESGGRVRNVKEFRGRIQECQNEGRVKKMTK
jgi:hypothetical protein